MRIIFVRHAEAIERTESIADERRYLDPDNLYSSASFKWMALGRKLVTSQKNWCRDWRIEQVKK